jgi:hypothetical protein
VKQNIGSALLVVVLLWLGITAVTWVLDLAHRGVVLVVAGVVLFAVAKLARKS